MTDPRPSSRSPLLSRLLQQSLAWLALYAYRNPWTTLLVVATVTTVSVLAASRLHVDADAASLLPDTFPSVKAIEEVRKRLGPSGTITIVGMDAPPDRLRAFADDIAPQIEQLPDIAYVQKTRPLRFIEDHALYYLDERDLETLSKRLERRVDWELAKHNPLFLDLSDDDDQPPKLQVEDLATKLSKRSDRQWLARQGTHRYYLDERSRMVVLMAKPSSRAADLNYARKIIGEVQRVIDAQNLKRYGPRFHVELSGRYKKRIDQQDMVTKDLSLTSLVALALMVLYLAVHFRRPLAIVLVLIPLLAGLSWMFGLAYLAFGSLNILTGFVGAILLGLGIDHGIHLLGRYETERSKLDALKAMQVAFGHTGKAAFIAALTSAAAFAGIAASQFRGFREFGVIAGSGMLFVLLAYTLMLPALIGLLERRGWRLRQMHADAAVGSSYARGAKRWAPVLAWLSTVATFFLIVEASKARFNYDFSALNATNLPSVKLDKQVNRVLGYSQTPLVVLAKDAKQEKQIANEIRKEKKRRGKRSTVDMVVTVSDLVPDGQQKKQTILDQMARTLKRVKPSWLSKKDQESYKKLLRMVQARPFSREQLPVEIKRLFSDPKHGGDNGFVQIFSGVSLSDGQQVRRLAAELRSVQMPNGKPLAVAGEGMILADILNMVWSEGPEVMLFTMLLVFVIMWVLIGSLQQALAALSVAMAGIGVTLGLMALTGVRLNYLNLIFLVVLVGIGVDASVHLITGWAEGGSFSRVLDHTGRSIAGATLTTALGFGSLMLAHHPGLKSVGQLTILGMLANLLASLVLLVGWAGLARLVRQQPVGLGPWGMLATVGGAGLSPVGPGTLGAIVALPIAWLVHPLPWWGVALVVEVIMLAGIYATNRYLPLASKQDPSEVVVDELAGALIAMVMVPMTVGWQLAAFALFRVFDIGKPWPIGWLDRKIHGGLGVMADDIVAGLLAGGLLFVLHGWIH